ncbi:MAG: hypothetical protein KBT88_12190 [Gammaproteobacteria bacterium]|nr:hypothetical protein [Gammaproteobacteria bacterium]MBQ0840535.1 hypothetical protein [Gammaproteobacteria bacterium]
MEISSEVVGTDLFPDLAFVVVSPSVAGRMKYQRLMTPYFTTLAEAEREKNTLMRDACEGQLKILELRRA